MATIIQAVGLIYKKLKNYESLAKMTWNANGVKYGWGKVEKIGLVGKEKDRRAGKTGL